MGKYWLYTLMLSLLFSLNTLGQSSMLRFGDKQAALGNHQLAVETYHKAYAKQASYGTGKKLAENYQALRNYEKAYLWWEKVNAFRESTKLDLEKYLLSAYQYGEGKSVEEILEKSRYALKDFRKLQFITTPKSSTNIPISETSGLNSSYSDFGVTEDSIGNFYFTSDRGETFSPEVPTIRLDAKSKTVEPGKSGFTNRSNFSIYRIDAKGEVLKLEAVGRDFLYMSDPSILKSRQLIFFTAIEAKRQKSRHTDLYPGIFYGDLDSLGKIRNIQELPFNNATSYGIMHPHVDDLGNRLFFSSNKPSSRGGYDIYISEYNQLFKFLPARSVGREINMQGNQGYPFFSDGILYFSSDGHEGYGGLDIYHATEQGKEFTAVENLGLPYNSPRDDFGFYIGSDGVHYIASDRVGGTGLDDIYQLQGISKLLYGLFKHALTYSRD